MTTPQASGRAFLGLIRHAKQTWGAPAFQSAVAQMPPPTRTVLAARVLHAKWYPYEAYQGFLEGLERSFAGSHAGFMRELGMASGKRDISTVFRIYLAIASTERLIRGCSKVWASYYLDAGEMTATSCAPDDTCLRITGFPEMAPQHCRLMEGWMIATMDALGVVVNDGRETACTSQGDTVHEFRCTWTKR